MVETRIVIDPEIRHGKPVIRGTRVSVELILSSLADGMEVDAVTREYEVEKEEAYTKLFFRKKTLLNKLSRILHLIRGSVLARSQIQFRARR
jgi:uncharacterized protein (DUF433 family)